MERLVKAILRDKDLELNLPEYYEKYSELNYRFAMTRLAMNYYTLFLQSRNEQDMMLYDKVQDEVNALNDAMEEFVEDRDTDKAIEDVLTLRKDIIEKLADLTIYVDRIKMYEYALNRIEHKFDEKPLDENIDEALTRKLMQFILSDEDRIVINDKIAEVVAQLPVRLSKTKFLDELSDTMEKYHEESKGVFDSFLYRIRTGACLETSNTMADNFPYLEQVVKAFEEMDLKEISEEEYKDSVEQVEMVSYEIIEQTEVYTFIQKIINDLLIVLYTKGNYKDDATEICHSILKDTNYLMIGKVLTKSLEDIESGFAELEGIQEKLYPKLSEYDITEHIKTELIDEVEGVGLANEFEVIYKLPRLSSDSIFAELEAPTEEKVTTEYFEKEKQELLDDFQVFFDAHNMLLNRAVMSATLTELPFPFGNVSELQDYIYNSLSACSDPVEKLACVDIYDKIISEWGGMDEMV
ncbi:MAG: hypothetical protein IJF94_04295 [Eubacterium sp.]|nr:hypothetical protein [Eubacterium sp.]